MEKPVRFLYLGVAMLVLMQSYSMPLHANEAQAAPMNRTANYQYVIPEHLNEEEVSWFKVFQEGNLLVDGWQKISAEILAKTPAGHRKNQEIALANLGKKIGMEWCRANDVRKVDTSMLQDWGGLLRKTAKKNPQQLAQAIATIDQELDAVLD